MILKSEVELLHESIRGLRDSLLRHGIYEKVHDLASLRIFMQLHVFAVWDFMSLLKALQRQICHAALPWLPPRDPIAARFVNEIVLGEESDEDGQGGFASHFELYRRAMRQIGSDEEVLARFLERIEAGQPVPEALRHANAPEAVQRFVNHTFAVIEGNDPCALAAAFTFGREDLLPDVFQRIVDHLDAETNGGLSGFKFYLQRHIELDGDEHGPMSMRMLAAICGDDRGNWDIARRAAAEALEARKQLWDGMLVAIDHQRRQAETV